MKFKTREIILVPLFSALTIIGAFMKIPIGFVPITLQYLFTALSGVLLGPILGAMSQLIYVILGLIGLPVFTSGGGLSYILTPTFGYLLGFIVAPYIIGKIVYNAKPSFSRILIASILGLLVTYLIGTTYMYIILNYVTNIKITLLKSVEVGILVFIPGDFIKCVITAELGSKIIPKLNKSYKKDGIKKSYKKI
ncbi:biotin transporter BioY [Clostridium akagii]|uniref:biotin transporter BioY n=1 Tax=Clostridium akagii TaxID=91623 RepID=UPI000479A9DE|nr:biotin transporter BioY [Clostridium akagii]